MEQNRIVESPFCCLPCQRISHPQNRSMVWSRSLSFQRPTASNFKSQPRCCSRSTCGELSSCVSYSKPISGGQRAYSLKFTWEEGLPALDEAFWRRQISQCVPQNVANARTHAFQLALTTPDAEGLTPWEQLQTNNPVVTQQLSRGEDSGEPSDQPVRCTSVSSTQPPASAVTLLRFWPPYAPVHPKGLAAIG